MRLKNSIIIILILLLLIICRPIAADIELIAKIAPKNDGFRGMVDSDQIVDVSTTSGNILVSDGTYFDNVTVSGDIAIIADGTTTIQANAVDSDDYTDASIDHEHLAPDVISGMADTTIADADYLLFWDATDSTLKKVDAAELTAGATAWDDIGNPDANDEIDMAAYIIELNIEDFRIGDGGSNYWKWNAGAMTNEGATSFELPNGADPTVDAEGEIAFDTDDDAIEIYNGTASRLIPTLLDVDKLIYAPDYINDQVPILHVDADIYPHGIKLVNVQITLPADAAYSMVFEEWAGDPPAAQNDIETITTTGSDSYMEVLTTSIDDSDIDADDYIFLDIPNTNVDWILCKVVYYVKEGN